MKTSLKWAIISLPLIEIALFIIVGDLIGLFPTLLLIVLSTLLGIIVLRRQNLEFMQRMQAGFRAGKPPMIDLMDNSLIVLGGFLLLIPGFLTDTIGLLCLIPFFRSKVFKLFIATKIFTTTQQDDHVIEGECWHDDHQDSHEE